MDGLGWEVADNDVRCHAECDSESHASLPRSSRKKRARTGRIDSAIGPLLTLDEGCARAAERITPARHTN